MEVEIIMIFIISLE